MDKFEEIMTLQTKFEERFYNLKEMKLEEREKIIKDLLLALIAEAIEVLNCINWKPWKSSRMLVDERRVLDEIVDCLHFVCATSVILGITAHDLHSGYLTKMQENIKRQQNKY
jgi:dimeric dUTPase (all-alpha-NTP-PPase superfamily)